MFNQTKKIIQDNITPLLFGFLIVFIVLSIYTQINNNNSQVKALIDFAESTTPYILNQTTVIANESLIASNNDDSYESTISQLNRLKDYCTNRIKDIPAAYPKDVKVKKFVDNLIDYLNHINQNIDSIILQQITIRDLTPSLETVSRAKLTLESGTDVEINDLIEQSHTIINAIENINEYPNIYGYLTTVYFQSYENLKILAKAPLLITDNSAVINSAQIQDLIGQINDNYPLNSVPFPAVRKYQIEDDKYLNSIKLLQEDIKELKISYNI